MASVTYDRVSKVYADGTHAVRDVSLSIADGEFMVLVGPSGCGKTTLLRMMAGLEDISDGELRIGDQVVNTLEPKQRDIAMVFQNYALYPHMTVYQNMAFPLEAQGLRREEINRRVDDAAQLLGLEEQMQRRPRNLSGGQRQRVAMGRAIVRQPKLFLMDEPLSNLDAKLRVQMRAEIARLQRDLGVTAIYVTHDQTEAMTMGDRVAVIRKGALQQCGNPQDLYDNPANLFVASFIGSPAMNLFRATLQQDGEHLACSLRNQTLSLTSLDSAAKSALEGHVGQELAIGVRPEHLVHTTGIEGDGFVRLDAKITLIESLGSERLVHLELAAQPVLTDEVVEVARDTDAAVLQTLRHGADAGNAMLIARIQSRTRFGANEMLSLGLDVSNLHFFDLSSGRALR